jgi:Xaa-Pro aminopeptidase
VIFSESEMQRRTTAIGAELSRLEIDCAFLYSSDNVFYATGVPLLSAWGRPMWAVAFPTTLPVILGAAIEQENMARYGYVEDVRIFDDEKNVWDGGLNSIVDLIKSSIHHRPRVGLERAILPLGLYERLIAELDATFVDISSVLADARLVKSPEELGLLRLGGQIGQIGANAFLEAVAPGATELAVAAHAVGEMNRTLGALWPEGATTTYAYCQVGDHSLTPHLHPTGRRMKRGDVIALNVFPGIWGYCVELERTYILGDATSRQRELLEAVGRAFGAAKLQLRPGVPVSQVHAAASRVFAECGMSDLVRHGTGHAHGIMIGAASREEGGELRSYSEVILREHMVNSIEPGLYSPQDGGFRHSDVMVVTEAGAECLTEFPLDVAL